MSLCQSGQIHEFNHLGVGSLWLQPPIYLFIYYYYFLMAIILNKSNNLTKMEKCFFQLTPKTFFLIRLTIDILFRWNAQGWLAFFVLSTLLVP
jgi:hypothetical protein